MSAFWEVIAGFVPVLSIAFVIEARRAATQWTVEEVAPRRIGASYFVLIAAALGAVLVLSLVQLSGNPAGGKPAVFAIVLTCFAFFALTLYPVSTLFIQANIDLFIVLARLLPQSTWRRNRAIIKGLKRNSDLLKKRDRVLFEFLELRVAFFADEHRQFGRRERSKRLKAHVKIAGNPKGAAIADDMMVEGAALPAEVLAIIADVIVSETALLKQRELNEAADREYAERVAELKRKNAFNLLSEADIELVRARLAAATRKQQQILQQG